MSPRPETRDTRLATSPHTTRKATLVEPFQRKEQPNSLTFTLERCQEKGISFENGLEKVVRKLLGSPPVQEANAYQTEVTCKFKARFVTKAVTPRHPSLGNG